MNENEIMETEIDEVEVEEQETDEGGAGLAIALLVGGGAVIGAAAKTGYDKWIAPKVAAFKESRAAKKAEREAAKAKANEAEDDDE